MDELEKITSTIGSLTEALGAVATNHLLLTQALRSEFESLDITFGKTVNGEWFMHDKQTVASLPVKYDTEVDAIMAALMAYMIARLARCGK
jgi:hypothetical protein